jgi:L-asparagine transporter-like permease
MKSSGNDSIKLWSQACLAAMTFFFILAIVVGSIIKKDNRATILCGITLGATIIVLKTSGKKYFNK